MTEGYDFKDDDFTWKLSETKKQKYPFDTYQVGKGFTFPKEMKVAYMRTIVSNWHKENAGSGKRFRVFSDIRAVVRVK